MILLHLEGFQSLSDSEYLFFWSDQHRTLLTARELRLACPCAACVDEWTRTKTLSEDQVPTDIRILQTDKVGHYALQFRFSDGHGTGIYKEELLRMLCPCNLCVQDHKKNPPTEPPCKEWVS